MCNFHIKINDYYHYITAMWIIDNCYTSFVLHVIFDVISLGRNKE